MPPVLGTTLTAYFSAADNKHEFGAFERPHGHSNLQYKNTRPEHLHVLHKAPPPDNTLNSQTGDGSGCRCARPGSSCGARWFPVLLRISSCAIRSGQPTQTRLIRLPPVAVAEEDELLPATSRALNHAGPQGLITGRYLFQLALEYLRGIEWDESSGFRDKRPKVKLGRVTGTGSTFAAGTRYLSITK